MAKLKTVSDKKTAQDIQIAAGMICLGFLRLPQNEPQQGPQQPPQPQQATPQGSPINQQPSSGGQSVGTPPPQQPQPGKIPPGIASLGQVLQGANDPAQAIAHAIYMAIAQVRTQLVKRGLPLDHRIWIMGGGVLDRVLVEIMMAIAQLLHFKPATDAGFVHQVKSDILELMDNDDNNSESIRVLSQKGLPLPKAPTDQGQQQQQPQQQQPQGLAAPQQGGQ